MADEHDHDRADARDTQVWDDESPRTGSHAAGHTDADATPDRLDSPSPDADATDSTDAAVRTGSTRAAAPAASNESVLAEQERLRAERAARREARIAALNPAPPQPDPAVVQQRGELRRVPEAPAPVVTERIVTRRSTDQFLPSLGLFLLRLAVAAILGVHGVNKLLNLPATAEMIGRTVLPAPSILAIVLGAAEVAIAIALVFGLMTRIAGLGVALIAGGALAFVLWGPWSPFRPGESGFVGELELLLAATGLLFMSVGGGGWAVDRGFRTRRAADRAAPEA